MLQPELIKKWIGCGGESDHSPIFFEILGGPGKPPSPFKFNPAWLKEESFQTLVKICWVPFDPNGGVVAGVHFASNLKQVKKEVVIWEKEKTRDERDLKDIEEVLQVIYESDGEGYQSPDSKEALLSLEKQKRQLLLDQEEVWRQKTG
jgi:hypothetical protein